MESKSGQGNKHKQTDRGREGGREGGTGSQTSVEVMWERSDTLKEGSCPRAGRLARGVLRPETGVKVRADVEHIEALGEVCSG